jgi:GTP-binding protein
MDAADARKLFAQPCACLLAAAESKQFPLSKLPEAAFIGRSNVGKSSLINALVGQRRLARASVTPGRTQQIVFFDLGHRLMLTDLPGYGFARAPKLVKQEWNDLTQHYLMKRTNLRAICLLIDSRRGLLKTDAGMMEFLDGTGAGYRVVLTKADLLRANERDARRAEVTAALQTHPAAHPEVLMTSADKSLGIDELRLYLAGFAAVA